MSEMNYFQETEKAGPDEGKGLDYYLLYAGEQNLLYRNIHPHKSE